MSIMKYLILLILCLSVSSIFADDLKLLTSSQSAKSALQEKPALEYNYFPNRLYAFVFRNWTSVDSARLAKVVGATQSQIEELASDMGLPPQKEISKWWESPRGYITVLRRNWHLLDYRQLLLLLNIDAKTLRMRLLEDDFLYEKLGTFKPKCEELNYKQPTADEKKQAKHIADILRKNEIDSLFDEVPRFSFVEDFSVAKGDITLPKNDGSIRIAFSYFSDYVDPLMTDMSYPDGLLAELAQKGVNGVWLHIVLNSLVEPMGIFAGSPDAPKRIKNLNKLIERAEKYGIKVWLYFNEPRGLHDTFYESSPERMALKGTDYPRLKASAMCTSNPAVLKWLSDATESLFRQAPKLGGVFTITASENPTNCLSRADSGKVCEVCKKRGREDIIPEINNTIYRAIKRVSPSAEVIAWDWAWERRNKDAYKVILPKLEKGIIYMTVSEIGCKMERGGVKSKINEYSLSVVGPSQRAIDSWKLARELGLRTMAKVQVNLSWEFASAPALPVMNIAGQHTKALRENGVENFLLSWSLGGYPTANLELFNTFDISKSVNENICRIAEKYYGTSQTDKIVKAWEVFSTAFEEYPFYISGVYNGPHNVGVANPIYAKKTNYKATMVGYPYDDLRTWRSIFKENGYISQMRKVADGFTKGVEILKSVDTSKMSTEQRADFERTFGWADTAKNHFASAVNQSMYVQLRDANKPENKSQMLKILDDEEHLAKEQIAICKKDSRIGFESSNHYFYTVIDLYEKLLSIDYARKN